MQIRDAIRADQQNILDLYLNTPELHTNAGVDFHDPDELEYAFADHGKKVFLVAVDDNGLAGFIYVKVKNRTVSEEKARILHLVVTQEKRGRGVALKLLKACIEHVRIMDLADESTETPILYCCCNMMNRAMRRFLEKQGFRLVGEFCRYELAINGRQRLQFDYDEEYDLQHDD